MNQLDIMKSLVSKIESSPEVLSYAQNIATAIVNGPTNHCAATLSALLVFVGIYPNGTFTGTGDLEPWVPSLAYDLEKRRGWQRVDIGSAIETADVGVVILTSGIHHIYLVVDATDQNLLVVADNKSPQVHPRAIAGDPARSWSPTTYFLRAPQN